MRAIVHETVGPERKLLEILIMGQPDFRAPLDFLNPLAFLNFPLALPVEFVELATVDDVQVDDRL